MRSQSARVSKAYTTAMGTKLESIQDFQSSGGWKANFYYTVYCQKHRFRTSRALEAGQSISIASSIVKSIGTSTPQLGARRFHYEVAPHCIRPRGSRSELTCGQGDCLCLTSRPNLPLSGPHLQHRVGLTRGPHGESMLPYATLLSKASISDLQSSGGSAAHLYYKFYCHKH